MYDFIREKRISRNIEIKVDSKATSYSKGDAANYKYCIVNIYKKRVLKLFLYSTIERQSRASTLLRKDPAIILDVWR